MRQWLASRADYPVLGPWFTQECEERHRFSRRMKLRDKAGRVTFSLADPRIGTREVIDPAVNLADARDQPWAHADWILPLDQ